MKLSLIFLVFFLLVLLSHAEQNDEEFISNSCPTARRLLFFGGITLPFIGGKKSDHVSSTSSPQKYARSGATHGLTVYIRPQTSNELGHKVRSYSHLLKSKLFTKEELAKLKKLKKSKSEKKDTTQSAPKTQDLVAVNDQERDRCRALLQIEHQNSLVPAKQKKQIKKVKNSISTKVKNVTEKAKKQVAKAAKALPIEEKAKPKKTKAPSKEKVKPTKNKDKRKASETTALTPAPPVVKQKTPPPPPPPPSPPVTPPSSPPPPPTKSKREKAASKPSPPPTVVEESTDSLDETEQDEIENEDKNNSVVGRAYSFVKNMFQLSDDILENNNTNEEDTILSSPTEQSNRQSRKLLSTIDDFSLTGERIIKRQLLSVKTSKHSTSLKTSQKKDKTNHLTGAKKPKVGWAYRYRISRYLAAQKTKHTGQISKSSTGGGKSKQQTRFFNRKLLGFDSDNEINLDDDHSKSNQEMVNTVTITQQFVPKRQLLGTKKVDKHHKESDDDQSDEEKLIERRRIKSYEDITDPVEIVRSYDRGLFKPRVGWQFRYRVSRYIDYLRNNIREDQERLKSGLEAIKRKTPQELSGRRKRVLDKPFAPETEETPIVVEENKPNVGWRYRYRISKMLDAKQRGEYVDDEELKRQARLGQKQKVQEKPLNDDEECIEWEFDLDPELRKISEEGKRVGWAYRYRIRRKLDELKQQQAETGLPFDLETLGGKREKKGTPTAASTTISTEEKLAETNKKAVGWQYRYRISKMLEAQKREATERASKAGDKKHEQVSPHERLDPRLARLKPEERVVGWAYRYRIRRKLDALESASRETGAGRRDKKDKQSTGKQKKNEEISKKIEESIEKILNIDDIDETPFMEYFRRTSSYVLFGLLPTVKKSICLLAPPSTFVFCMKEENEKLPNTATTTQPSKVTSTKKLRTKKEKQAKQFIQSRPTKLDSFDESIDSPVKPLSKVPKKVVKKAKVHSTNRRQSDEQIRHFDEEEQPIKKVVGVESKKKNKKRFQIIGQEVKIKPKHTTPSPITTTTSSPPPVFQTSPPSPPSPPPTTTTTTSASQVVPTTTATTPAPQVISTTTTTSAPLRTISEIIQEEAATLLSTPTSFAEETKEEINEANEISQSTPATIDNPPSANESDDDDDDNEEDSEDDESSGSDNDSNQEDKEQIVVDDDFDPLAIKKMKKIYENAKKSVHGVFDLKDEHDSS